jgi:hypothetical protein
MRVNDSFGGGHMADSALLEHESTAIQDQAKELAPELAEEAAELLGYSKLKQTVAARKGIRELSQVLLALDIQPLSPDSVEQYKAEAPDAAELTDVPEFFKRHRMLASIVLWLIPVGTIVSAIGIAGGLLISWKLGVASLVTIIVIFKKGCEFDDKLAALFPTWERVPLAQYPEEVPLYVLRMALAIKRRVPSAQFYIEQRARDPFLIVKCGEEEHYIEAWREPRFESRRQDFTIASGYATTVKASKKAG